MAEGYNEYQVSAVCDLVEAYTDDTTANAALALVRQGYLRFLQGVDPLNPNADAHPWSFLHPKATLTLAATNTAVNFPAGWGGLWAAPVYVRSDTVVLTELEEVSLERLLAMRRDHVSTYTAPPTHFAVSWNGTNWAIELFPTCDGSYTATYGYRILPPDITDAAVSFLGGAFYSNEIKDCAMAMAELHTGRTIGIWNAIADRGLSAAIARDKKYMISRDSQRMDIGY